VSQITQRVSGDYSIIIKTRYFASALVNSLEKYPQKKQLRKNEEIRKA
jgi:hypothetical protein